METLREEYQNFKRKVDDKYRGLIGIQDYKFAENIINKFKEEDRETIKNLLEEEDFGELEEYDFKEKLTHLFYNNRHGEELYCYLLSAYKVGGLYILDNESRQASFISFNDLNGIFEQIKIIEAIEELKE